MAEVTSPDNITKHGGGQNGRGDGKRRIPWIFQMNTLSADFSAGMAMRAAHPGFLPVEK
jgi:hypothetical protein